MAMTRQQMIRRWMYLRGLTYQDFADRLGVSTAGAYLMLHRDIIPQHRYESLRALGVPKKLLPAPRPVKRGFPCDEATKQKDASHATLAEKVAS